MAVVIEDLQVDEARDTREQQPTTEGMREKAAPPLDERMLREILARETWRNERLMVD